MKIVCLLLFIFLLRTPMVIAYPAAQLNQCFNGAKMSPLLVGVPGMEIEKWCDCVLNLTMDDHKKPSDAAAYCGRRYFK
ncbi:hypothetical protein [Prochlorococcus sp. MIT 1300]|uniref:hypothetical protein n=1 Tax=Prochlorococcus sp. MIT 1300 TaxID=3096218 RepID=UPI002A74E04D|nr:hypothetical protein [Prochlorococcus sp. MIT 1300]